MSSQNAHELNDTKQHNTMNTIEYNKYNTIQYNTIQYTIQYTI